jgi:hypothetical protein
LRLANGSLELISESQRPVPQLPFRLELRTGCRRKLKTCQDHCRDRPQGPGAGVQKSTLPYILDRISTTEIPFSARPDKLELNRLVKRNFHYDRFAKHRAIEGRPVLLAGCWAHGRRGFYEAFDHAPKEAGWVLIQIGHLYDIERSLRRQLFFGDADAGERSAIIYSIIESCRRHDIEPYTYLRDVLTRLPTMTNRQIKDIVPKAWVAVIRNTAPKA